MESDVCESRRSTTKVAFFRTEICEARCVGQDESVEQSSVNESYGRLQLREGRRRDESSGEAKEGRRLVGYESRTRIELRPPKLKGWALSAGLQAGTGRSKVCVYAGVA